MQDLSECILRITNDTGETLGTGFAISENLAVTCAHVVAKCGSAAGSTVRVVFHANDEARDAEVIADYWRAPDKDDIAVLKLLPEGRHLPANITPATLGPTRACNGHSLRTIGFAKLSGGYDLAWAEGHLRGVVPHPNKRSMLQMDATPIRQGMSGAPVLDLNTGRVVGIVNEFMPSAPLEWATTAETLQAVCPVAQLHPSLAIEDYLTSVREYCTNLPYLFLRDVRLPMTTADMYVPLRMRPSRHYREPRALRQRRAEPLSVIQLMQSSEHVHVLILGDPGAGKSTLLRHLAECAWGTPQQVGLEVPHLPILVPLRRLIESQGSLEQRINHALTSELFLVRQLPDGYFTQWPEQTGAHWLLLLDALDEVSSNERARLIQSLHALVKNVRHARTVITSRPSGYVWGELDDHLFGHYDLLPFVPEQTGVLIPRLFVDQATRFLQELERVRVDHFLSTPLLLAIAAKVFLEKGNLPERRSALYAQAVDIWLSKADQNGLKNELGEPISKIAKFVLARLALTMTEKTSEASEKDLLRAAADHLSDTLQVTREVAEVDANQFLQVMVRRSGVFIKRGGNYDFIHPTFREYLAAVSLTSQHGKDLETLWERAVARWREPGWREIALFVLSMESDEGVNVSLLIRRVAQQTDEGLYFAVAALADNVIVDPELSNDVVNQLLAPARNKSGSITERVFAEHVFKRIEALSTLQKSSYATNAMLSLAADGAAEDWVRIEAAAALGKFGRIPNAAAVLLELTHNEKTGMYIRQRAIEELGRLHQSNSLFELANNPRLTVEVRAHVVQTLLEMGYNDEMVPILVDLTCDEGLEVDQRVGFAEMLSNLGRADESARLLQLLAINKKVNGDRRVLAIEALERLGQIDEAEQAWLSIAGDPKVDVWAREKAIERLGQLANPGVLHTLQHIARSEWDEDIRRSAQRAIKRIRKRRSQAGPSNSSK